MNRTRRKAAKMFKRRYGRATYPWWQAQPPHELTEAERDALLLAFYEARPVMHVNEEVPDVAPDLAQAPRQPSAGSAGED